MYRTLIADDDFLVRSYLRQLDAWEKAGFEIIAEARDGEEALQIIEKEHPDVVITDISMPAVNGIDLIRKLRQINRKVYIIVLSCHDDFEYVKEAMKLGADEYVLKNSLDNDTLYELLKNSEKQIENSREERNEDERTKKLIRMGSQSLKYHFFNQLISGTMTSQEREKKRKEAGIHGKFINSAVINMFIPNWYQVKSELTPLEAEQYGQLFLHSVMEQFEKLPGKESEYVEVVYLGEGVFCCFLDLSNMCRSSLMKQKLTSVASICFRCCQEEKYDYAIGVSNICIGEEGIKQAYQQAREMIKLSFYENKDILYFDSQKTITTQMPAAADKLLEKAESLICERRYEEMKERFEQLIDECTKKHVDSKVVIHWLKSFDEKLKIDRNPEEYTGIVRIGQLLELCEDYRKRLFCDKVKELPEGVNSMIKQAVSFINSHYKEQIGLGEVAESIGLNPAYFSYLFKQEMGIGFSNYLLECRMECAKNLLKNTNYKIKEVASESGFNDYHYFSKAFKKINEVSPADYRKREK